MSDVRPLVDADITYRLLADSPELDARVCRGQDFAFETHLTILRPGLLPINIEPYHGISSITLNIDGSVCAVDEAEVLVSPGDCRILRGLYIGNRHGMGETLCHLKLRPDYGIVKRGRYLADASADGIYYFSIFIRAADSISVILLKGACHVICREFLSRVHHNPINFCRTVLHILAAACVRTSITGLERTQDIPYLCQLFLFPLWLCCV